jgi:hypothetical protein
MKVKELLADPARWTKEELSRDKWGCGLHPRDEEATCWCIAGGIMKCYQSFEEQQGAREKICRAIDPEIDPKNVRRFLKAIFNFNDSATHAEVLKVIEEADV